MSDLTTSEWVLLIGSTILGVLVFAGAVYGIVYFFKRIEREDKAEEEEYSEQPPAEPETVPDN